MEYLAPFSVTMCVLSFVLFGFDKVAAVFHRRRIPEGILLLSGLFFGAFGSLTGMVVFKHKTRKVAFYIGIPVILFIQLGILYYLFF